MKSLVLAASVLALGGRVGTRQGFEAVPAGPAAASSPSWVAGEPRFDAKLEASLRLARLRAVVEAKAKRDGDRGELALGDAFLSADLGRRVTARGGSFKLPISALDGTSSWTLPTIRRGEIAALFGDEFEIGGRHVGGEVAFEPRVGARPSVRIGVWNAAPVSAGDGTATSGEVISGRIGVSPGRFDLGMSAASRSAAVGGSRSHYDLVGIDLAFDAHGVRVWTEALGGSSWLDYDPGDGRDATMASARAVVAYRIGGRSERAAYVEAWGSAGILDPDLVIRRDAVEERSVGLNVGQWRAWRAQAGIEERRRDRNLPDALGGKGRVDVDRTARVQLGLSF